MKKRIASLLMAMLMVFTLLPVEVLAQESEPDSTPAAAQEALPAPAPVEEVPELTETDAAPLLDAEEDSTGAVFLCWTQRKTAPARSIPVRWAKTSAGRWTPAPAR